jgi:hypothetical protein
VLLGNTCYFFLQGANLQGAHIVYGRLWEALVWRAHNITDAQVLHPYRMSIGYSAYPEPCNTISQCLEAANIAYRQFAMMPEKSPDHETSAPHVDDTGLPILARKLGIPYLSLLPRKLPAGVQRLLDPRLALELHCYPLGREKDVLTVAMSHLPDQEALDRLARETGLQIFPVLAHPQELETALETLV